jgi:O-antigen/teichoic acid export membrane protein
LDLKPLGRNTAIYALGNIGLRAASFLLIPLYAHILPQADFGRLAAVLFTVQIMLVLMNAGVREAFVRLASEARTEGRTGELLGTCLFITAIGGGVVTAVSLLFLRGILGSALHTADATGYVLFACAIAAAQTLVGQFLNHYRAANRAGSFLAAGGSIALVILAANGVTVGLMGMGVRGALIAQLVAYTGGLIVMAIVVLPGMGVRASWRMARRVLAFGSPLVVSEAAWFVMLGAPIYFLSYYAGLEEVAVYSLGFKLAQVVVIVLVLPFQLAYSPFVFSHLGDPKIGGAMSRALTYFVLAFVAVAFGILAASRVLIPVIAPAGYGAAGLVLLALLPAMFFQGIESFGKTLLHIERKSYVTGAVAGVAGALSVLLNLILIPRFGWRGAVVATAVATALAAALVMAAAMRTYPIRIELGRIAVGVIGFGLVAAGFIALRDVSATVYLLVAVPAGGVALGALMLGGFFDAAETSYLRRSVAHLTRALGLRGRTSRDGQPTATTFNSRVAEGGCPPPAPTDPDVRD